MTDDTQPDSGSVSDGVLDLDSATALLTERDERPEDQGDETTDGAKRDTDNQSDADEPTAEDSDADREATDDADEEDDTEAEAPPIPAPHSWDKEAKERFAKLDRDTQEYLVNRENERDKAVSQKLNEAAQTRKQAEEQSSKLAQYAQQFDQIAQQAQQRFADRWQNTDWQRLAQEQPAEYVRLKAQHEADQHAVQQTQIAQQAAEQQAHTVFMQREAAQLAEVAPDLADPEKGSERKKELGQYLAKQGVTTDQLKWASAGELALAYKAMMYDRLQAQPAHAKSVQQKQAPKAVKPAAEAKTKPRKAQERDAALKRLERSGSRDDAVAAILAMDNS